MATSGADVGADDGTGGIDPRERVTEVLRRSIVAGTAILLPLAVTLLLLEFVLRFISSRLTPFTKAVQNSVLLPDDTQLVLVKALTVATLLVIVLVLGLLAEYTPRGSRIGDAFDELMGAVPGVGSIYTSFNEMSEILLDSDTDSFQDVKLVEYPTRNSYTVAFKTADTPSEFENATDTEDMVTLFMPMAPNPVMGGFVVHVAADRVVDVDMTVEQGIRSIVTSGVAVDENGTDLEGLSPQEMRRLGRFAQVDGQSSAGQETTNQADDGGSPNGQEAPGQGADDEEPAPGRDDGRGPPVGDTGPSVDADEYVEAAAAREEKDDGP